MKTAVNKFPFLFTASAFAEEEITDAFVASLYPPFTILYPSSIPFSSEDESTEESEEESELSLDDCSDELPEESDVSEEALPEEDGDEESFSEALSETAEEESELPSTTVPQEAANSVHDIPRASKNNKILRFSFSFSFISIFSKRVIACHFLPNCNISGLFFPHKAIFQAEKKLLTNFFVYTIIKYRERAV